ncbi:MAG: Rrf2 family transcriptional regulator [Proteobacteria bacterium]|nr:Rrf2 family transcriptional regulator [Pseudomonadota bacterium]HOL37646.1 Rrf2 family transcriptional regulator [Rubrivivax sp.]
MRMSTKGRIAVNAVVDLALREHAGPVTLASIGERQHTSLSYLEQMFSRLRRAGIVESTRGPGGGYTLGRPAAAITVADIVTAVDAPPGGADGAQAGAGHTQALWQHLGEVMVRHMAAISLASVVASERTRGVQVEARLPRRAPAPPAPPKPVHARAPNSVFAFGRSLAE